MNVGKKKKSGYSKLNKREIEVQLLEQDLVEQKEFIKMSQDYLIINKINTVKNVLESFTVNDDKTLMTETVMGRVFSEDEALMFKAKLRDLIKQL